MLKRKNLLALVLAVSFVGGVNFAFAAARSAPFAPGQTIDPGTASQPCGPLDANCFPSAATDVASYLAASSTVPKTYTANVYDVLQTFATTTFNGDAHFDSSGYFQNSTGNGLASLVVSGATESTMTTIGNPTGTLTTTPSEGSCGVYYSNDTIQYRIWAYTETGTGVQVYSDGSIYNTATDDSGNLFCVYLSWAPVSGALGYILQVNDLRGPYGIQWGDIGNVTSYEEVGYDSNSFLDHSPFPDTPSSPYPSLPAAVFMNGGVGIGTTTPVAALDIVASSQGMPVLEMSPYPSLGGRSYQNTISGPASAPDTLYWSVDAASGGGYNNLMSLNPSGNVGIGYDSGLASTTGKLVVNGNVGIGTTSPWTALSVNGNSDLGSNAMAGYFTASSPTGVSTFLNDIAVGPASSTLPLNYGFSLYHYSPYDDTDTGENGDPQGDMAIVSNGENYGQLQIYNPDRHVTSAGYGGNASMTFCGSGCKPGINGEPNYALGGTSAYDASFLWAVGTSVDGFASTTFSISSLNQAGNLLSGFQINGLTGNVGIGDLDGVIPGTSLFAGEPQYLVDLNAQKNPFNNVDIGDSYNNSWKIDDKGNATFNKGAFIGTTTFQNSRIGVGTSSPFARVSLAGGSGSTTPLFVISTSTAAFATTTVFEVDQNGLLTMNTPGATSTINGNLYVNGTLRAKNSYVGDLVFGNGFRFTEAPLDGIPQGLYLENQNGSGILSVDENGNLTVPGDICANGAQCFGRSLTSLAATVDTLASSTAFSLSSASMDAQSLSGLSASVETADQEVADFGARLAALSSTTNALSSTTSALSSILASSTLPSSGWFEDVWGSFIGRFSDWGVAVSQSFTHIANLFVGTEHVEDVLYVDNKLCVDDVCVNKDQLKALLIQAGGTSMSTTSSVTVTTSSDAPDVATPAAPLAAASSDEAPVSTNTDDQGLVSAVASSSVPTSSLSPATLVGTTTPSASAASTVSTSTVVSGVVATTTVPAISIPTPTAMSTVEATAQDPLPDVVTLAGTASSSPTANVGASSDPEPSASEGSSTVAGI